MQNTPQVIVLFLLCGNKNRLNHESFYQSKLERLLHLDTEDCKNEHLKTNTNKNENRKLVNYQVFPNSANQAQLEIYQGHVQLCDKFPYHGAHGRLTYDLHDKNWKLHIRIKNPSICKAGTKKSGYQEIKFFDCKIQLEKGTINTRFKKRYKIITRHSLTL